MISDFPLIYDTDTDQISTDISLDIVDLSKADTHYEKNKCRALWRAVILQAILDSVSESSRSENKLARSAAINWLTGNSKDFGAVCQFAEYDTKYVTHKVHSIMESKRPVPQPNSSTDSKETTKIKRNSDSASVTNNVKGKKYDTKLALALP